MSESTFNGSQIRNGVLVNAHIHASAAIATSKLADGATFIRSGGSVPFGADQSMGGFKLTNVATGVSGTDAVNVNQLEAALAAFQIPFKFKDPARLATTTNINLSNPGTSTFDGVTINTGERLWVRAQTDAEDNGIYVFDTSSTSLVRAEDFDEWDEIPGAFFVVQEGTAYGDTIWLITNNDGGTLDTTDITFTQLPTSAGYTNSNFVDNEAPSGTIDGSNDTFTLANNPTAGSVHLYYNGQRLKPGAGNDYTISSNTITWIRSTMPIAGDAILADYRK